MNYEFEIVISEVAYGWGLPFVHFSGDVQFIVFIVVYCCFLHIQGDVISHNFAFQKLNNETI